MLASIFLLNFALAVSADVLDLSANDVDSFKSELQKYDTALVEFFAPWCGHCKRLAPEYEKAAKILQSHDPPVPLTKVDCTSDQGKELCSTFGVSGYPTLKIFRAGEFASEYNGPRDSDGIVKYMKAQVGPSSRGHSSYATLNDKLKKSTEVVVVGIFPSETDSLAKKFRNVADKMREQVDFAHVYTDVVTDSLSSLTALPTEIDLPKIILFRPSMLANKFEESFVLFDDSKPLEKWIPTQYHGMVGHRTQSNMNDFERPLIVAYYDVDYVKDKRGTNYWRNRIFKVAQYFPEIHFAISNAESFAGEMEEYGLEPQKSGRDVPPQIVARSSDDKKYVMKDKFSVAAFEAFVKDFIDGKLQPYVKSEPVPADNNGPVKVAVASNFGDLVTDSKKDVFIEFYAPWCGHCKNLAPIWEELGTALKDEPNVDIVKMDATANDIPSAFTVHGFPTLYWYSASSKTPVKYEGGRELKDLLGYVAANAGKELKGYDRNGKKKESKEEL